MAAATEADINEELLTAHKQAADLNCFLAFNVSDHHRAKLMDVDRRIAFLKMAIEHTRAANNIESMKRCAAAIQDHIDRMHPPVESDDSDSGEDHAETAR